MNEFGKIITLTRGDTLIQSIYLNKGTNLNPVRYILSGDDKLYIGIMEPNQKFEDAIIKKVYTKDSEMTEDGDLIITINSSDTENLISGLYYYAIKMQIAKENYLPLVGYMETVSLDQNSGIWTVVPNRKFLIID